MLKQLWRTNAPLTFTGLLMLPALAIAIAGLLIDPRIITDEPAWLKPAKFAVSIAIYVFTLAWAFTLIPGWRKTRPVVGWATAITMVLEFAIVALQAYRGTTSHFNFSTPLNGVLFIIMGVAIVAQTFISMAVAVAFWRQRFEDPAMGWALRLGMIITIAGALSAGFMTATGSSVPREPNGTRHSGERHSSRWCCSRAGPRRDDVHVQPHARDIALRRRSKQAAVLAAELRGAFIAHPHGRAARVEVLVQHQLAGFL